jgi:hypothetical protein
MVKTRRSRGFPTPLNPKALPKPITPTSTTKIVSSSLYKSVHILPFFLSSSSSFFFSLNLIIFVQVSLHDWWLVKAPDGKGLAVGGFASLE